MSASKGLANAAIAIGVIAIILSGAALAVNYMSKPAPAGYEPKARAFTISISDQGVVAENATGDLVEIGETHAFRPNTITVYKGDNVTITVKNVDEHAHSFVLTDFARDTDRIPGDEEQPSVTLRTKVLAPFVADKVGVFQFKCGIPFDQAAMDCAPDHNDIVGYIIVLEP